MSRNDFVSSRAEESEHDEDEELEDAGDETEAKPAKARKGRAQDYDDSSEEEEEENEEDLKAVQEGFIVEDEDEEEEQESHRRHKRKKRRHREEEEEDLDAEDIDLVYENTGIARGNQFKRLKRGRAEESERNQRGRELLDISSDEEDIDQDARRIDSRPAHGYDEMEDFIEDSGSEGPGESDNERRQHRREGRNRAVGAVSAELGLSEEAVANMEAVFGDGGDYEEFLVTVPNVEQVEEDRTYELKDVFEPSELAERMLTDEDNEIRGTDVPERFQLARKPYKNLPDFDDATLEEEGKWIAQKMLAWRPSYDRSAAEHFIKAVKSVVVFMNKELFEVPFIWQHRRDYLQYTKKIANPPGSNKPFETKTEEMIDRDDLWEIFEYDLKFRSFYEKRAALKRTYESLRANLGIRDETYENLVDALEGPETVADLLDYLHFQYHSELKDVSVTNREGATNGTIKRPRRAKNMFERIRTSKVYGFLRLLGISSNDFAVNVLESQPLHVPDDPDVAPLAAAEDYVDESEFSSPARVLSAAKTMFVEEMFMNPGLRKYMAQEFFRNGLVRVVPTEKGINKIDDQHIYYEFKYLRNQPLPTFFRQPAMFLQMLKAEDEGLVEVRVELESEEQLLQTLYEYFSSENVSDVANAWNAERRNIIKMVMERFEKSMQKYVKETVRNECEDRVALSCRRGFFEKLDQAPYHTPIIEYGEVPRVLAISPGHGERAKDSVVAVFVDEHVVVKKHGKFSNLKDDMDRSNLVRMIQECKPDVIGIAGFSVQTHKLKEELESIISDEQLTIGDDDKSFQLEVVYVPDDVARLYQNSPKSREEHPDLPPLGRYCVALARYMQDPLLEYAAIGKDIVSLKFDPAQHLVPEDKLKRQLESAMVDIVNVVGVRINDAMKYPRIQALLPYVAGLGPRKATTVQKLISVNGGRVNRREELVGDPSRNILPVLPLNVFNNAASFLIIDYDEQEKNSEYFDSTRVHIEDYDLGRKMAADALEYDEEDIAALQKNSGANAVITELLDGHEQKLYELILEDYADELETNFNQKKRATLETIRDELIHPYEEKRSEFRRMREEEIFTMLTGETRQSLRQGMVVPVNIRRVSERFIGVRLDCGVDGNVASDAISDKMSFNVYAAFEVGQTVQGYLLNVDYQKFFADVSLRESDTKRSHRNRLSDHHPEEWDEEMEEKHRARMEVSNQEHQRTARVIKHPLFRSFNRRQAEEYLKGMSRGDAVIRPSSNGMDHIAITWKVAEGIYQHIDVLELDKDNEFSVGKTLRVQGKYSYSDLDELIVEHVKAMARKVDEITSHPKFPQNKNKAEVEQWLVTYTTAYPTRCAYAFCYDPQRPGYFLLCFKAGKSAPINIWSVRVVAQGFELKGNKYPDMTALCNGFKMMWASQQGRGGQR